MKLPQRSAKQRKRNTAKKNTKWSLKTQFLKRHTNPPDSKLFANGKEVTVEYSSIGKNKGSFIYGMHYHGDLEDFKLKLRKFYSCGACVDKSKAKGNFLFIEGDIRARFEEFLIKIGLNGRFDVKYC